MVSQQKRMEFRQEIKQYSTQELYKMKSNLDLLSDDKQTVLLEELLYRDKHQDQLHNKKLLEYARNANKIASRSNCIAVFAIVISIASLILSYLWS